MMDGVYYVFTAGEPIRCPGQMPDGQLCGRAQDVVGPGSAVRLRFLEHPREAQHGGSTLRICRRCEAKLELTFAPTTPAVQPSVFTSPP